jgi:hypothetical protein
VARRLVWLASLALVTTLAAGATIAVGRSGSDAAGGAAIQSSTATGDPVAFVKRVVGAVVDDDYRRAWRTLHPAHQLVAPLETYVRCEWREPIPGRLQAISVLAVADRRLVVPGLPAAVATTAVQLRLTIEDLATGEHTVVTSTFHAVPVAGRWRWVLPGERYALYRRGGCGDDLGGTRV